MLCNYGNRKPMKYCKPKGRSCKDGVCKRGFPHKVVRDKFGKVKMDKYRVRVVCRGVAAELKLKCTGRRNMMGALSGKRRCEWFASTAAILAHVFRSNTNVQVNYRLPITKHTHDEDCKRSAGTLCILRVLNGNIARLASGIHLRRKH